MSTYEISKSSLLSLKAEIIRKEEDLAKAKIDNAEKRKLIKKKALDIKNKGVEKRQINDLNDEEQDLLKLSKSKLEAKSKLYDKLASSSEQSEEINRRYLVRFDEKQKDNCEISDVDQPVEEDEENHSSDDYDEDVDPDDEWVDYTDCLGRSRKCLRKDLEYLMSKDADLKLLAEQRQQSAPISSKNIDKISVQSTDDDKEEEKEENQNQNADNNTEMTSSDMRREMLRKQWEQEEDELRDKTNIYYQNVLFDEARQHGVGYYAFSKDEEKRAQQQDELKKIRAETEQKQKRAQELKALREKQMALRMKAARNRRRARLGLPPEEDEPTPPPEPIKNLEEEKKKQEEIEKQNEIEALLTEARKSHVRPWDIGKEGVKEFYQMSQEEWNDKKRKERPAEFAPPSTYGMREFSSMKALESDCNDRNKELKFSTMKNRVDNNRKRKLKNINPYKHLETESDAGDSKNSSYNPEEPTSEEEADNLLNHYKMSKSGTNDFKPVPIVNEVEETDFDDSLLRDYHQVRKNIIISDEEKRCNKKRTEIPPPPTFEYYGPSDKKPAKKSFGPINIEKSIEAGLKFLRNQTEKD